MASIQAPTQEFLDNPPSTVSTPGLDFPGAYPKGGDESASPSSDLNTAKSYIPAQKDVTSALANAGVAAKSYLPQSVQSYFGMTVWPYTMFVCADGMQRQHLLPLQKLLKTRFSLQKAPILSPPHTQTTSPPPSITIRQYQSQITSQSLMSFLRKHR